MTESHTPNADSDAGADWRPLPEDVSMHTLFWLFAPHEDGRQCARHQRLRVYVTCLKPDGDYTPTSEGEWVECLREHSVTAPAEWVVGDDPIRDGAVADGVLTRHTAPVRGTQEDS